MPIHRPPFRSMAEREGTPEDFARLMRGETLEEPEEHDDEPREDDAEFDRSLFAPKLQQAELVRRLHGDG